MKSIISKRTLIKLAKADRDDWDKFLEIWCRLTPKQQQYLVNAGYIQFETEGDYEHGYYTYPQGTKKLEALLKKSRR